MKARVLTGVLAAVGATALLLWGPSWALVATALICAGLSAREFDRLFFTQANAGRQIRQLSLVFLSVLTLRIAPEMAWIFLWLPLLVLSIQHVVRSDAQGDFEQSIRELSIELLGVLYVVCMLGFLLPTVESGPYGRELLLLLFLIVFGGDTAAFFVGMRWGRHRLVPQLSPKKSLEGSVGAVIGSSIAASVWMAVVYSGPRGGSLIVAIVILVPVLSLLAQFGDLFESMLKRSRAQKDSGHLLPGHGGILDRLDGLTLSAPAFYFFVRYVWELL